MTKLLLDRALAWHIWFPVERRCRIDLADLQWFPSGSGLGRTDTMELIGIALRGHLFYYEAASRSCPGMSDLVSHRETRSHRSYESAMVSTRSVGRADTMKCIATALRGHGV